MTQWQQLTIYVTESDQWQGQPVYIALVEAARKQGIAGATVTRGIAGYGARGHHQIHTARLIELSSELPIVITVIDTAEAIDRFLPFVKSCVTQGLVLCDSVNVVHPSPVQPS